jgi:ATP-binding cassette subfamily B protein
MGLVRAFWPQIRSQRRLLFFSFLALTVSIAARVFEPWPLKLVFDWVLIPQNPASGTGAIELPDFLSGTGAQVTVLVLALLLFTGIRAGCAYLANVGMALSASRVIIEIRARLFSHLQRLSLNYHDQAKSGDLVTRFTYDVERLRDTAVTALLPLFANFLTVIVLFAVMFWFNWQLAIIPLAVLPLFFVSSFRTNKRIQKVVREHRLRDSALASVVSEAIGLIKSVQALSLGALNEKALGRQNKKSLKQGAKAQRLAAGLESRVDFILALGTALVLWRGTYLVLAGAITPGTLVLFISYMNFVFRPMRQVAKYLTRISKATASGERILEIFDIQPEIKDLPGAVEAGSVAGGIEFERVSFRYGRNKRVLDGIDFKIEPGQRVALVGHSGAGKSTVLALLMRLYDPSSGRVLIDGRDLREYKVDSIRQQIAIVLQESVLFAVSLRDNIAYGNLEADQTGIERAARLANAHDFIMELPEGYDTVMSERGATLSGGQRQRIAIARAVVRNAPILVLDEPTHGLDHVNSTEVVSALEQGMQGKTTILITHDLLTASRYDRILFMDKGKIVEQGTHQQLMERHGPYHRLYTNQLEKQLALQGNIVTLPGGAIHGNG